MDSRKSYNTHNAELKETRREGWIKQKLSERVSEYTDFHDIKIFTGTWNVNAKKPMPVHAAEDLCAWIHAENSIQRNSADIYAIGFQEIVDLNAVNVVVNNMSQQRSQQWEETIKHVLNTMNNSGDEQRYCCVLEKHLVGILLLVFVKEKHYEHVQFVKGSTAGVGVMGMMGNKGAVAIRMNFYSSTLCFVCSHLAAHRENVSGRNADFMNIMNKIEFDEEIPITARGSSEYGQENRYNSTSSYFGISRHDFVIWLGDLNYRITEDVSVEECFKRVENKDLDFLVQRDQLCVERSRERVFQGFEEGPITFPPTYKFQTGTSQYARKADNKKTRAPAWCDRILWRTTNNSEIRLMEYGSTMALVLSDHKPVRALFTAKVKYEVELRRNQVLQQIIHELDKYENEKMPKVKIEQSVITFADIRVLEKVTESLWVENIGNVVASFRFVPKLDDSRYCKPWLSVTPSYGMIPCGEKVELKVTVRVEIPIARLLAAGSETLDDTMILRIENGRDYFVIASGHYHMSCFGMTLNQLVKISDAVDSLTGAKKKTIGDETSNLNRMGEPVLSSPSQRIPKEIWRMVDDLFHHGMDAKGLFQESGDHKEIACIRNALDQGKAFPEHGPLAMAEVLVSFLRSLREPVVSEHLLVGDNWKSNSSYGEDSRGRLTGGESVHTQLNGRAILHGLSSVHYNVFIYIVSFLRETLKHSPSNKLTPHKIALVFSSCLTRSTSPSSTTNDSSRLQDKMQKVLLYFCTTTSL